jgi:hypothetical protein
MKYGLVALLLIVATAAQAEVILYAGVNGPPPGWADAKTYSLSSSAECRRLIGQLPDSPAKKMIGCLVRIDPNAKLPMS